MKISLIICAYNEEKYIGECLKSIIDNPSNKFHEIIVVDNNSTDGTRKIVEKFKEVKLVTELNKGPNHARQKGFEVSTGEILGFIDADTRMPENWFEILVREFNDDQNLVCLSGPYVYYDFSKWKQFLSMVYWYVAYPIYLIIGYMAIAGNFIIKRDVMKKNNGFDTSIAFYGDDTDNARRASKYGKVKFKLDFVIYSSARRLNGQGTFRTGVLYVANFFSEVLMHKPITKNYQDIR